MIVGWIHVTVRREDVWSAYAAAASHSVGIVLCSYFLVRHVERGEYLTWTNLALAVLVVVNKVRSLPALRRAEEVRREFHRRIVEEIMEK
jgi:hypothetical protein